MDNSQASVMGALHQVHAQLPFPLLGCIRQRWRIHQLAALRLLRAGRRTDVVGIFPHRAAVIRLVGAVLAEQRDSGL